MAKFSFLSQGRWIRTFVYGGMILLISLPQGWGEARADVSASQKPEVKHLFDFISQSGCRMVRNGETHDAPDAVKHIQRKYDYYRSDIKTTEDFIDRAATKSSMSGKRYTVECPGQKTRPTAQWLKEELNRFRMEGGGS